MRILDKKDTFSFILSAICAADCDNDYTVLADLIYMLDEKAFKRFVGLFEGQTIKVPTISRMKDMLGALMLYTYVDLEGKPLKDAMKELGYCTDRYDMEEAPAEYERLKKLIDDKRIEVGGVLDGFPPASLRNFK